MPQLEQIATYPSQVFWLVVTFIALFVIMWRVAVPRISDALEARQQRIDDNLERAAEIKKEAEAAMVAYKKSLAEARAEAQGAIAKAMQEVSDAAAKREAELTERLQARLAESEAGIARAVEQAVDNLKSVAVEVAQSATERLVGEAPSTADAGAAVEGAIKARGA
jgi:F-type H+-transporting ATPase subunit b